MIAAADAFVGRGKRGTDEYGLVYRSTDHRRLKELCDDLAKPRLSDKYMPYLPTNGFGPNILGFAAVVKDLQEKRHVADYDPISTFDRSEVLTTIRTARAAIRRLGRASPSRRRIFLTLLMFPPRR